MDRFCYSLVPQFPQNLVPGGLSVPQDGQRPDGAAAAARLLPQLLQNFTVRAFFAPHCGQSFRSMDAPQLLQNFPVPAGFPQDGQTVVLLSISPFQTVALSPAASMLRRMASARALAT